MIRIRVELISAYTNEISLLSEMHIINDGNGTHTKGNYYGRVFRKGTTTVTRKGNIDNHPRLAKPIWNLIYKMLVNMGYDQ